MSAKRQKVPSVVYLFRFQRTGHKYARSVRFCQLDFIELGGRSGLVQNDSMNRSGALLAEPDLEQEFKELADEWRRGTGFLSMARQKAMHPAYQKIIGMGRGALPFIFKELESRGGDWIWALEMIVRNENPAAGMAGMKEAVTAWLEWGRKHGFAS